VLDAEQKELWIFLAPETGNELLVFLESLDTLPDVGRDGVRRGKVLYEVVDVVRCNVKRGDVQAFFGKQLRHLTAHATRANDADL
jgi:hypothetical protein